MVALLPCLSWRPHKGALSYSGIALAYSLMHPVFSFYYVKVFLDIYKISENWFHTVQILYMIWNALNDPLFGYCQDNSNWAIVKSRRHTILYGAPFFALSFLVPWFPWGDYEKNEWLCGLHLFVALFFYDAMFTYVLLAAGCLYAEMSTNHEDRIRMTQYGAYAVLIGSCSVFICETMSHHLFFYGRFQCLTVILAALAYLAMRYTGNNAVTLYDKKNATSGVSESQDRSTNSSIFRLTWQILSNPNFAWFVVVNFMTELHSTFASNFCMIIVDSLIDKEVVPSLVWNFYYGVVMVLPRLFFIIVRPLMSSVGYYKIMRGMMVIKFVSGLSMYFLGHGFPLLLMLFLMVDSVMAHSMGSMFGLVSSDIIDDDVVRYERTHPLSSMVMGTNALITKPAQSLAPMITVYVLNSYGYEAFKAGTLQDPDTLKGTMFSMVCLLPIVLGIVQLLCWSRYRLRDSYKKKAQDENPLELDRML